MPCPPQPDDPAILITKTPTSTTVSVPGPVTYVMTAENVGPGPATDVQFTDELPPGATWTIGGSGSNVCSITGSTLSCFVPDVPDGVFEVVEVVGTLDGSVCGLMDNSASIAWTGGPDPEVAVADAETVEVSGCSAVAPSAVPNPSGGTGAGGGGGDDGDVPDTGMAPPGQGIAAIAILTLLLVAGLMGLVKLRLQTRS